MLNKVGVSKENGTRWFEHPGPVQIINVQKRTKLNLGGWGGGGAFFTNCPESHYTAA